MDRPLSAIITVPVRWPESAVLAEGVDAAQARRGDAGRDPVDPHVRHRFVGELPTTNRR